MSYSSHAVFQLDSLPTIKPFGFPLEAGDRCPDFFVEAIDGTKLDLSCFVRNKLWIAF